MKRTWSEYEEELILRCQKNDHTAFKELYEKYAGKMMAIAARYCNTTFEAEDLLQEIFINVFRKIKNYKHKGSFEGWLRRMVVNLSINHYHRTAKQRNQVEISNENESLSEWESGHYEEIISRLSEIEIIETVQKLPEGYRMVFNLYEIEGYSHKEIADQMGISEGTSKSQLFKAKKMLQSMITQNKAIAHGG